MNLDPSKCIFVSDDRARARAFSPEEMLANKLSAWRGWHCSAGVDNIFIDGDGKIFVASCALGGDLGNVYLGDCKVRDKWFVCTKGLCTCGADMRLAKVKNAKDIERLRALKPTDLDFNSPMGESTMVGRTWEPEGAFNLNWDVGRRCNFSCSYCSPTTSNTFEKHKTWEQLSFAAEEIERFFCRGRKGKWVFTGGEPTLSPYFMQLVKDVASRGHLCHTQSNGSRSLEYYAELLRYSLIGFSLHLEFTKIDRLLKVLEKLIELKSTDDFVSWRWIGVRIMTGPGRIEEALTVKQQIAALPGADKYLNQLVLAPLYDVETASQLQDYPSGELNRISEHS